MRDIIVNASADAVRSKQLAALRFCGEGVVRTAFKLPQNASEEQMTLCMAKAYNNKEANTDDVKQLDYNMKVHTNVYNDKINKYGSCLSVRFMSILQGDHAGRSAARVPLQLPADDDRDGREGHAGERHADQLHARTD